MKDLTTYITEKMLNRSKVQKWLGDRKNHKKFHDKYGGDLDLIILAFSWVEDAIYAMDEWNDIESLANFLKNDAPEGFPLYAEDNFDDMDQIQEADWDDFFNTMANELEKLK